MNQLRIDIVSDVVCPWCVVGYRQLEEALQKTSTIAEIHWHPFELNPQMPATGQNLTEHICEKYGMTAEQSEENREKLTEIGKALGFDFNYNDSSRMVNTFRAHQLLHWAGIHGKEHELKQALFKQYFTAQEDIHDIAVLEAAAESVGLEKQETHKVIESETYASAVRQWELHWTNQGIRGVPAMIFNEKYLLSGAQGSENYGSVIEQIREEQSSDQ